MCIPYFFFLFYFTLRLKNNLLFKLIFTETVEKKLCIPVTNKKKRKNVFQFEWNQFLFTEWNLEKGEFWKKNLSKNVHKTKKYSWIWTIYKTIWKLVNKIHFSQVNKIRNELNSNLRSTLTNKNLLCTKVNFLFFCV